MPTANLTVVESTGFQPVDIARHADRRARSADDGDESLGQTTFFGIFVSGEYCFSVTSGSKQAYQCYTNNVPASVSLAI